MLKRRGNYHVEKVSNSVFVSCYYMTTSKQDKNHNNEKLSFGSYYVHINHLTLTCFAFVVLVAFLYFDDSSTADETLDKKIWCCG